MAAFFPRTIYNTEASFTPLFRLLDDFDSFSGRCGSSPDTNTKRQQRRAPTVSSWRPKFDVRETADAYELYGELPGLNKGDVNIEFTEPQTLVVRGKVERTYTTGTTTAAPVAQEETLAAPTIVEETPATSTAHQASVADEDAASIQEENGFEIVSESSNSAPATPETKAATVVNQDQPQQAVDTAKYWLTERSIGGFSRSFSFPSRVDQDAVSAGFQDGILSISVPKAKKHEPIRISIN